MRDTDIDAIVAELARSWNAGDSAGWAAVFSEDAVFVDVLGRVQRGRAIIGQEHRKILDTIYRGSHLDVRLAGSRTLGDGTVLAHTTSTLSVPTGPRAGETEAIQTKVVEDGLITVFQNTIRSAPAEFAGDDPAFAAREPLDWGHGRG